MIDLVNCANTPVRLYVRGLFRAAENNQDAIGNNTVFAYWSRYKPTELAAGRSAMQK